MATMKQKAAVDKILGNPGLSVGAAMRQVGYSENTIKNPSDLTDSKGYKELLDEYLPDSFILNAIAEDIRNKPGNRAAELNLAAKVRGRMTEQVDHTGEIVVRLGKRT